MACWYQHGVFCIDCRLPDGTYYFLNSFFTNKLIKDKLVPHFGKTAQVSFSFFSYHLAISIFGVVDKTRGKNYVYLVDKLQAGPKNGDHTVSYLFQ